MIYKNKRYRCRSCTFFLNISSCISHLLTCQCRCIQPYFI